MSKYGRLARYSSVKRYQSPFLPFSSFGGGGNLGHYRYIHLVGVTS